MDDVILKLTKEVLDARDEYRKAKELATSLEKKKKKLEFDLCSKMDDMEIPSFKHEEYGTIYRSNHLWCKIVDTEKAYNFLREQGVYDDVMQLAAKSSRLNALVKKVFLEKSGVVPEAEIGIEVTLSPTLGNRK